MITLGNSRGSKGVKLVDLGKASLIGISEVIELDEEVSQNETDGEMNESESNTSGDVIVEGNRQIELSASLLTKERIR